MTTRDEYTVSRMLAIHKRLEDVCEGIDPTMHEPDQWDLYAHVIGDHLDNAMGEDFTNKVTLLSPGHQHFMRQEYVVVLERTKVLEGHTVDAPRLKTQVEVFNLADLIALARKAVVPLR